MPRTFNNSIYVLRNGSTIKSSKWYFDLQEYVTRDFYVVYNEYLRHWKKFGKSDTGRYILVFNVSTFKRHFILIY